MATYVTNEPTTSSSSSNFLIGLILVALLVVLLFVFGRPLFFNGGATGTGAGTDVNLPSEVNVQTK